MKKIVIGMALMILQGGNLTWGASYLLHLRNGNELRTSHYWEEDDEIKFYIYGGIAGVQKTSVINVTVLNLNSKEEMQNKEGNEKAGIPLKTSEPRPKEIRQTQTGDKAGQPTEKPVKDEVIDFAYYKEKKAALKEKLEDALQRNREATANQDQGLKDSTRKEYLDFSKQFLDLEEELKRKNKGVLPPWWND